LSETDPTLLIRVSSLSGALLISLVVVLVNWLIIALLGRVLRSLSAARTFSGDDKNRLFHLSDEIAFQIGWYYFIDPRAPPVQETRPGETVGLDIYSFRICGLAVYSMLKGGIENELKEETKRQRVSVCTRNRDMGAYMSGRTPGDSSGGVDMPWDPYWLCKRC
jgi:hypothetical protein